VQLNEVIDGKTVLTAGPGNGLRRVADALAAPISGGLLGTVSVQT